MTRLRSEREEFWTPDNFPFDLIFYEPKKGCRHWREVREGDMTREQIEAAINQLPNYRGTAYLVGPGSPRTANVYVPCGNIQSMIRRAFGIDGDKK